MVVFSLVQHLLYQVDPMADSYEMNHMVVNTTVETVWYQKASRAMEWTPQRGISKRLQTSMEWT